MGIDETNTQFVPTVTKTRCRKGVKKVRLIGVGMEKPQITTTFGASASGKFVEPAQLIFGGTTVRCQYFDHTSSHWQTPESFITYHLAIQNSHYRKVELATRSKNGINS